MKRSTRKYVVKSQPAKIRTVELEIKEITESVNANTVIFQFLFTNHAHFNVTLKDNKQYYYWKGFQKGDKVYADVRAQKIEHIYHIYSSKN